MQLLTGKFPIRRPTGFPGRLIPIPALTVFLAVLLAANPAWSEDPLEAAGYTPNTVYESFGADDTVNTLSGNVILQRPLFQFSVGRNLSWGLTAHYNSSREPYARQIDCESELSYPLTNKSWVSPGWTLHLGRIHDIPLLEGGCPSASSPCDTDDPTLVYVSPDGAHHELHQVEGSSPANGDYITRDGTWLRARSYPGGSGWKLFMPDGTVVDLRHLVSLGDRDYDGWYATRKIDTFGNYLDVTYHPGSDAYKIARIADRHGLSGGEREMVKSRFVCKSDGARELLVVS